MVSWITFWTSSLCRGLAKRFLSYKFYTLSTSLSVFALATTSCQLRPNVKRDLVEAELRNQERQNRELKQELDSALAQAKALEAKNFATSAGKENPSASAQDAAQWLTIRSISLGIGTGGVDQDSQAGDEAFQVVLIPKDAEGSAIKVPGQAIIMMEEVLPTGIKQGVGSWQVEALALRKYWKTGLFSTGYYITVPWQVSPTQPDIFVTVKFTTPDGVTFQAEKTARIRLPGSANP